MFKLFSKSSASVCITDPMTVRPYSSVHTAPWILKHPGRTPPSSTVAQGLPASNDHKVQAPPTCVHSSPSVPCTLRARQSGAHCTRPKRRWQESAWTCRGAQVFPASSQLWRLPAKQTPDFPFAQGHVFLPLSHTPEFRASPHLPPGIWMRG